MIEIDGTALYQWDVGRRVVVTGIEVEYVHFANQGDSKAVIMGAVDIHAQIPDFLLQSGKQLCVYAVKDGITVESKTFYVKKRERPENYVYEDDQRNYIYELITNAEESIESMWWAYQDTTLATEKANLATENANASAASANQAAGSANLAAGSANEAAKTANEAATKATQIASEAATEATQIASKAAMEATQTANEAAAEATHIANEAATKAAHTAKSLMVIGKDSGASIHLDDAIDQFLVGLRIFGNTTQDGTPTPDTPVELVSVGDGGSITVNVTGDNEVQSMTIATPNGLPGIPVASGGNYTDANGQQWVCDEIDFVRGVYIQRISRRIISNFKPETSQHGTRYLALGLKPVPHPEFIECLCSTLSFSDLVGKDVPFVESGIRVAPQFEGGTLVAKCGDMVLNNLDVMYIIEPIETPLAEEELAAFAALRTYRGGTTVSNDASAHMEIEYVMDAKKYIDSMISTAVLEATVE